MLDLAIAGVVALVVWWLATGVVMFAAWQGAQRQRLLLLAFVGVAILGCAGLYASARMESVAGTYLAFLSALAVWAFLEATFLFGMVTGPRQARCPREARGLQRFRLAFLAVRDHEFALVAGGLVVAALVWGGPNHAGLWTFALLWVMRLSAKLNIFLGAPRAASVLIPRQLRYLTSYFRTDRVSWLLPATILAAVVPFALLLQAAFGAADVHRAVAFMLLSTFLGLAVLEHVFLVLPVSDELLWLWAARDRAPASGADDQPAPLQDTSRSPTATPRARIRQSHHKRGLTSWT
ncbi:putative photosynthetic complex assembly protein PuhE [Stappia sp.]|uniref:putative photosynthetic complex assembly protein PuhE n=1 Tax=Stappia sp. TaxID=1870903 RepID=UPI0032D96027